ncbi:hypothetical protein [Nostocoides sp. F2B08]|uniref:hypothetical protein n=1 Tax=Nostocoides sp. F2B08 TaxID=2653936 RepID=UPI001D04ED96|nr:hypothetical protein [Tetrasphaera sp. F2B08]
MNSTEPTTYVAPSTGPPTALTKAGTDPRTKQAEPRTNSTAIPALSRAGRTDIGPPRGLLSHS